MITSSIELLEDMQKTYAAQYGLTLFLTDDLGNIILSVEGNNELCNKFLQQEEILLDEIKKRLKDEKRIAEATLYEVLPGIHVAAAPVQLGTRTIYYLWAGMMVDGNGQEIAEERLTAQVGTKIHWDEVLKQTPIVSKDNKQNWLQRINKVADLAAVCLEREQPDPTPVFSAELLKEYIYTETNAFSELFSKIIDENEEIDFLGIAEQSIQDVYEVSKVTGVEAKSLNGVRFSTGEGFLGRSLLTGESSYWENIEYDHRSKIFRSFSSKPKSVFCEPIKRQDGSTSLLFGGSFSKKQINPEMVALGKTLSILVEVNLLLQSLRLENTHQLSRLTSLVDICKLMASTPDLRRILFILVDISINLVEGPFSCVILKDRKNNKIQLVSRGDFNGQLEEYVKEVIKRSHNLSTHTAPGIQEPKLHVLEDGDKVIECPLFQGNELLGILCVGVPRLADPHLQEHLAFLQTLSIIGSVSIQLSGQNDSGLEEEKTEALYLAVAQFDKPAFELSKEAAVLSAEFTTKIETPATLAKEIIQACQLVFYSIEFIREIFPDNNIAAIMEEGKAITEGEIPIKATDLQDAGQIFALVNTYIKKNHSLEEIMYLKDAGEGIFEQFTSFVKSSQIIEREFELSDGPFGYEGNTIADAIKNLKDLSPREKEVMALISEGKNNREIAASLYISDHTVKNHVTKIFQKMGVSDRANAITKVYRSLYNNEQPKKKNG